MTIRLNLGCGYRKDPDCINIDNQIEATPDLLCDVTEGLSFRDSSVDEIIAEFFLEFIPTDKVISVMEEIHRALKPGGKFWSMTPSTDGRGAFQNPKHRSFWNLNTWFYFMDDAYRKLYGIKAKFEGECYNVNGNKIQKIILVCCDLIAVK